LGGNKVKTWLIYYSGGIFANEEGYCKISAPNKGLAIIKAMRENNLYKNDILAVREHHWKPNQDEGTV